MVCFANEDCDTLSHSYMGVERGHRSDWNNDSAWPYISSKALASAPLDYIHICGKEPESLNMLHRPNPRVPGLFSANVHGAPLDSCRSAILGKIDEFIQVFHLNGGIIEGGTSLEVTVNIWQRDCTITKGNLALASHSKSCTLPHSIIWYLFRSYMSSKEL